MPRNSAQDIEAAIAFTERNKWTHENWALYLEVGGRHASDGSADIAGDLEHHLDCIQGYEHVLSVLWESRNG